MDNPARRLLAALLVAVAALSVLTGCVACPPAMSLAEPAGNAAAATQLGRIAEIVASERPDVFVGSSLPDDAGGDPTLYVKGPRDACIDQLIHSASVMIRVAYDQPHSFSELEARQQRVHEALLEVTDQVVTGFDITRGGRMEVVVTRSDRLPDANAARAVIPDDLRASVDIQVVDEPVVDSD